MKIRVIKNCQIEFTELLAEIELFIFLPMISRFILLINETVHEKKYISPNRLLFIYMLPFILSIFYKNNKNLCFKNLFKLFVGFFFSLNFDSRKSSRTNKFS